VTGVNAVNGDLFELNGACEPWAERLGAGTMLLHGFAAADAAAILADLVCIVKAAPFRHMVIVDGRPLSVAMTNCGALGWLSDTSGYRYASLDPQSGLRWPRMPDAFSNLARAAASQAGFTGFTPDACLINRYATGARMSLHQDKDEHDFKAPIVSVSLGLPAIFLLGGVRRADRAQRLALNHGDVLVWGGPDRLRYHGVQALKAGYHPLLDDVRINLTFRQAG
jgi:alkylated DNA repair protein (DNA oxidative demethylase)